MGTNSIRTNISKDDIISEIRLTLGADIKKEKVILILEGKDDIKVMSKLVSEKVDIIESFSGKEGVKEIVYNPLVNDYRLIGIVDRDYDEIPTINNIFYYDYCCLEMMIISYSELFDSIYYEYYDSKKLSSSELKIQLLNNVKHLSILRKYNYKNLLGLKFDGINVEIIQENGIVSVEKLLNEVKRRNSNKTDFYAIEKFLEQELKREWPVEKLLEITQGHDFISLFHSYCKKEEGREASKDSIASSLRCSLNADSFRKTNLYNNLIKYEEKNNLKIV